MGLLHRKKLEEKEQLPLNKHEKWRILSIDFPRRPIEEHQWNTIEAQSQALAHRHERVSHYGSIWEPDPVVDDRNNRKRKVDATDVFGIDHVLHVHHGNHVDAYARQRAQGSTHRHRKQVKVEDLGDQNGAEELLNEVRLGLDAQVNGAENNGDY